jgi:hypothetical protein
VKLCIFCPNPRTIKRGEHVWDDWLNREGGKDISDPSTTHYFGTGGALIRSHPSTKLDVTIPVVCDDCNHHWMSDISNLAKTKLEPIIRRDQAAVFDEFDILVTASLAFLKTAILDWSATHDGRKPCISRDSCLRFRRSLTSNASLGNIAFPDGLHIWIARYRRKHKMEALAFTEELVGARQIKGYRILVVTYVIGSFIFQVLYPRWNKPARNRPATPSIQMLGDNLSVPIWPGVTYAYWPPFSHVDGRSLESFRERFRRMYFPTPS